MTKTKLTEALQYAEVYGFSVFPVGKDKRPLLSSWKEYQEKKADEKQIRDWWKKFPDANIGIVTGKISGISVVDVDVHKGGSRDPFPKTYAVKTGNGGYQLYYRYQEGLSISANAYPQFPFVDIRSDGGYVVAPPSVTDYKDKSGKRLGGKYEVIDNSDFAPFPIALFGSKKPKRNFGSLISVSSGSRNDSIASFIGSILLKMKESEFGTTAWNAVLAVNRTYDPPLYENELRTTFDSIVAKELERRENVGKATPSLIQISPTERIDILLRKNGNGVPYKDMANALLVLEQHPRTKGKIRYNDFRQEIEFNGNPLSDEDILLLVNIMQEEANLPMISKDSVYSAIQRYASKNRYDEALDWLKSLEWDGKDRIDSWLVNATGVEDDKDGYHSGVGAQWFRGLVSRLMHPGCIFDYVLVIVGSQGVGKTSMFRIIGGPWYKSFTGTVENKDFYLSLRGSAIIDLDEGVALYRSESIKMKSIITQVCDEYRAPYDRVTKKFPRRFVFSMSTNDSEPFRDATGNRRYWVVDVKKKIDFKWLEENRDQLYAEAYFKILHNIPFPEVPLHIAQEQQELHLPQDEWTEAIVNYIRKSPEYCRGDKDYQITVSQIYDDVLKGIRLELLDKRHEMRIGNILRKDCGLERRRVTVEGERRYRYVLTEEKQKELEANPIVPYVEKEDRDLSDFVKDF